MSATPGEKAGTGQRNKLGLAIYAVFAVLIIAAASIFSIQAASGGNDVRAKMTVIAPAAPGGGWDTVARELQQGMRSNSLVPTVDVVNMPGANGTIALGKLTTLNGQVNNLMVSGSGQLIGTIQNETGTSLDNVTPIARLVEEYNVIVVPKDSPYQSLDELLQAWKANPGSIPWTGGGSFDLLSMASLASAVGIPAKSATFVPSSGGGEVTQALLNGTAAAASSGYPDMADQIESGNLRALALTAPERVEGVDIPTAKELGYEVSLANWRMLFAPPGITEEQRSQLVELVRETAQTEQWQKAIPNYKWNEVYEDDPETLSQFLQEQREELTTLSRELGK